MSFFAEVKGVMNDGWDVFARSVEAFSESDGFQAYLYGMNDADQNIGRMVNTALQPFQLVADEMVKMTENSGEWAAERYLHITDARRRASSSPGSSRFIQAQTIPALDIDQLAALTSATRDTVGRLELLARHELPAGSLAQQQMLRLVAASRTAVGNVVQTMGQENFSAVAAKNDLMTALTQLIDRGATLFRHSSQPAQALARSFLETLDAVRTSFTQGRLHASFVTATRQAVGVLPQLAGQLQAWASSVRSASLSAPHPFLRAGLVVGGVALGAGATILFYRH